MECISETHLQRCILVQYSSSIPRSIHFSVGGGTIFREPPNRSGANNLRFTWGDVPVTISWAMASPDAGPIRMPCIKSYVSKMISINNKGNIKGKLTAIAANERDIVDLPSRCVRQKHRSWIDPFSAPCPS